MKKIIEWIIVGVAFVAFAILFLACAIEWKELGIIAGVVASAAVLLFIGIQKMPMEGRKCIEPRYICMRDVHRKYI